MLRHRVLVSPRLVSLRVDESLYFANARALEDRVNDAVAAQPAAASTSCFSARPSTPSTRARWKAWRRSTQRLREAGIALHLSEVKGPVMDRLQKTEFMRELSGKVFLTHYQAVAELTPELLAAAPG